MSQQITYSDAYTPAGVLRKSTFIYGFAVPYCKAVDSEISEERVAKFLWRKLQVGPANNWTNREQLLPWEVKFITHLLREYEFYLFPESREWVKK